MKIILAGIYSMWHEHCNVNVRLYVTDCRLMSKTAALALLVSQILLCKWRITQEMASLALNTQRHYRSEN